MNAEKKINEYERKAKEIISQITIEEKVSQLLNNSSGIERLGIKPYNWWNEALHGVARSGVATVFPQAIGLAATFDEDMMKKVGDIISTEGRAKFNQYQKQGDYGTYKGLTYWSPNVNIFRDPRWGRGHETYGEDPYLSGELGVAYIKGVQGDDPANLKAAACAKHYVVHSGPEKGRNSFDSKVTQKDLYETYLPAFKACVQRGNVEAVMGAYNSVNGEVCCGSRWLIEDVLRNELGFKGHYVSDCGGVASICNDHKVVDSLPEAAAMALNNGCDLNCGSAYEHLVDAYEQDLVEESTIDTALLRLLLTKMKLGLIGGVESPYANTPYGANNSKENYAFSLEVSEKTMTLLKNNGILPLNKNNIKRIAVIGPNANSRQVLEGNYSGTASRYITVLDGIQEYVGQEIDVIYAEGCHLFDGQVEPCAEHDDRSAEAITAAENADVVVLCVGLDATIEGEQGDAFNADSSGDKLDLSLPGIQNLLIDKILATDKPVILVNLSGSAIDLRIPNKKADAVIQAWYPGAAGGLALARMIFGEFSPAGRLPVTFYNSVEDLPDFHDYSMENRTYRYFNDKVLYPFGYGLSYTDFSYSDIKLSDQNIKAGQELECSVSVKNIGNFDSDEVVQLYLKDDDTSVRAPKYQLKGFKRIHLTQGQSKTVKFVITPDDMSLILENGKSVVEKGKFTVYIGGAQPDEKTQSEYFTVTD